MNTTTAASAENTASDTATEIVRVAEELASMSARIATGSAVVARARDDALTAEDVVQLLQLVDTTLANAVRPITNAAARFLDTTTMDFLLEFASLVRTDQELVRAAAEAAEVPLEEYPGHRLDSAAYAFAGFYSWICAHGNSAAITLACYADILQWHNACKILVPAMEKNLALPEEVLTFFGAYRERPTDFLDKTLLVTGEALAGSADLLREARTARVIEYPLTSFWEAAGRQDTA